MKFYKLAITGKKKDINSIDNARFINNIQFSKNQLMKSGALGIDIKLLSNMAQLNVENILLTNYKTGNKYICSYLLFMKYSWIVKLTGFLPQRFLMLDRFDIYNKMNTKIQEAKKTDDDIELDKDEKNLSEYGSIPFDVKLKMAASFKNKQLSIL